MMELKDVVPLGERSSSHAIDPSDRVRHNLACPMETLHRTTTNSWIYSSSFLHVLILSDERMPWQSSSSILACEESAKQSFGPESHRN